MNAHTLAILSLILIGCGTGKPNDDISVKHSFCVLVDPQKIGDERYQCKLTARFSSEELCRHWQQAERHDNPSAYDDGRLRTKCEKE